MTLTVKAFPRLDEAARALAATGGAGFIAGGTLVMRAVNAGRLRFDTLVRTTDPAFTRIESRGDRVVLGGGVTMIQVLSDRELSFLAPVARKIGGPALRTTATVGGNVFARSPYGDFTCALLALDAELTLLGPDGETLWALEDFLLALDGPQRPTGIVSTVSFARPPRDALRFRKVTRIHPRGVSLMTIAALLPSRASRVAGARIAYGSMARRPIRVPAVEQALEGQSLNETGIAQALQHCLDGIDPPTDPIASNWYRREVAPVHLKRVLLDS